MNAEFCITAIGYDVAKHVEAIFAQKQLRPLNEVNEGRLGNFRTFTYILEISEEEVIPKRRKVTADLVGDCSEYVGMYKFGDWMRFYVFKRFD